MARFNLRGVSLHIPNKFLNDPMIRSLRTGRYESSESFAIECHLTPTDRVLELGGGAGFLSVQIAKCIGPKNLMTVEANNPMVNVIAKNMIANDVEGANIIHAAVVSNNFTDESVTFHATRAFWGASTLETPATKSKMTQTIAVPAVRINELWEDHRPTVVMMDVEGAEADLFDMLWPDFIRLLVIEMHPTLYEASVIKHIFDQMSCAGFTYCPTGSRADVVVFKRV